MESCVPSIRKRGFWTLAGLDDQLGRGRKSWWLRIAVSVVALVGLVSGCSAAPPREHEPVPAPPAESAKTSEQSPALVAVSAVTPESVWAAGDGLIVHTTDAGASWQRQYSGQSWIIQLDFVDDGHGWALARDALFVTEDGGAHWGRVGEPTHLLWAVEFLSQNVGFGVTGGSQNPMPPPEGTNAELSPEFGGGELVRTKDGGQTWSALATPVGVEGFHFVSSDEGWIVTGQHCYGTRDGGSTWQPLGSIPVSGTQGSEATWLDLKGVDRNGLWGLVGFGRRAGGMSWGLYHSADGGRAWTLAAQSGLGPAREDLATEPRALVVLSDSEARVVGVQAGQWLTLGQTKDAGDSWRTGLPLGQTVAIRPFATSFSDPQHGWIVLKNLSSGDYSILSTDDGGGTWHTHQP